MTWDVLQLVRGAVSKKDLVPLLSHFCMYGGRIQGTNGFLCIDAACAALSEHEFAVPADRFIKAIDACHGEPLMKYDHEKRVLVMSRGRFKAKIQTGDVTQYPRHDKPEGTTVVPTDDILKPLRRLRPFIGEDASRRWCLSVFVSGGYAYATNNVIVVRVPFPAQLPDGYMIPGYAVDELLRINEPPQSIVVGENHTSFFFGDYWVKAQLDSSRWPDIAALFERIHEGAEMVEVPPGLAVAVDTVAPFSTMPEIILTADQVTTPDGDHGAEVDGFTLHPGRYRTETLQLVLKAATLVDFSRYPQQIPWAGEQGMIGIFVGVRA